MLIINDIIELQVENNNIFERSYEIQGATRRSIMIRLPKQDGVDYEMLSNTFVDGVKIINREISSHIEQKIVKEATEETEAEYEDIEVKNITDYPLTDFVVAGDIVDKRDGSFVVYMGTRTETEIVNEEMAELLLEMGGIE